METHAKSWQRKLRNLELTILSQFYYFSSDFEKSYQTRSEPRYDGMGRDSTKNYLEAKGRRRLGDVGETGWLGYCWWDADSVK